MHRGVFIFTRRVIMLLCVGVLPAAAQDARFLVQPRPPFVTPGTVPEEAAPAPAPPADPYPLFTRQNMAPDTPDIVREAFNDPTRARAEAAYDWLQRRHAISAQIQTYWRQIDQERKGLKP